MSGIGISSSLIGTFSSSEEILELLEENFLTLCFLCFSSDESELTIYFSSSKISASIYSISLFSAICFEEGRYSASFKLLS